MLYSLGDIQATCQKIERFIGNPVRSVFVWEERVFRSLSNLSGEIMHSSMNALYREAAVDGPD